jgi:hypothetical protein
VGTPDQYPANSTYSNILGYADYALVPSPFSNAPPGVDEIFTEIEEMDLTGYVDTNGVSCSDPRVPTIHSSGIAGQGGGALVTVKAGPGAFGIGPSLPLNRRSIGMVQQITNGAASDFPAQSFFDIFVEVTLPPDPNAVAGYVFPTNGAVLYNDASDPLFIQNLSVTNLPPTATYVHGNTTAVPIRFKYSNPPYWAAGDVLGYLTLAGHGVFTNAVTATAPCPVATATGGLLDQTLGPVGSPIPPPPIAWLRPTNSFPTPDSTYNSVVNTVVDSGNTNVLDDTVSFTVPTLGTLYVRDISLGNLQNPISPPPYLGTNYYNPSNTIATMALSVDQQNWFTAEASGPASMTISNTTAVGSTTSTFDTEMLSLELTGGSPAIGPFMLRESPTKQSLGKHTIASDPRGYRVSSFFDVFLELSTDGGKTWNPANRSIRLLPSLPPAVPGSIFVTGFTKTNVMLQWQNNFTLQSTPDLKLPFTDVAGPVTSGSYTNPITGNAMFFRLRQ